MHIHTGNEITLKSNSWRFARSITKFCAKRKNEAGKSGEMKGEREQERHEMEMPISRTKNATKQHHKNFNEKDHANEINKLCTVR